MAAKAAQDEQTVKKVAVVGGGLVRISVKVPGFLEEIIFFLFLITLSNLQGISYSKFRAMLSLDLIDRTREVEN